MAKILITGGLGFIGSHLALSFYKIQHEILLLDNLSRSTPNVLPQYANNKYNLLYFQDKYPKIQIQLINLNDYSQLYDVMDEFQPNLIIHTAGQTSAVDSLKSPLFDFSQNVQATVYLLNSAMQCPSVNLFMFISSNKVYGKSKEEDEVPLEEEELRYKKPKISEKSINEVKVTQNLPRTPYGTAKYCAEQYIQELTHLAHFHSVIFRLSCIYGHRQFGYEEQGWIAHFLIQAMLKKPISIYGNGKQIRDILHINDLSKLFNRYYALFENETPEVMQNKIQIFDVGGGAKNTISLRELIKIIETDLKLRLKISFDHWRLADQKFYISDIEKISKITGWKPTISPSLGIQTTFEWLSAHKEIFIP
jgi:CDP-paratose 2-epimerase